MWENLIWFIKQNRRYNIIQWRDITQHEKGIYQVLIFFISSGFDASINFIAKNVQKYLKFLD